MKKTVTTWLLALCLVAGLPVGALGAEYSEGKQYTALSSPQPTSTGDRIEVVELFWYGCPHCYDLEPYVRDWQARQPEDVELVRMPAILGDRWELLAKAYYTAELLGILETFHPAMFEALHEKNMKINDVDALRAFFVEQGVTQEQFDDTFASFAVAVRVNNARQMTRRYRISGVPTLIVNGKYQTGAKLAGSNAAVFEVVDYLVDRERPAGKATTADQG